MGILGARAPWRRLVAVLLLTAGGIFAPALAIANQLDDVEGKVTTVVEPAQDKPEKTQPTPVLRSALGLAKAAGPVAANPDGTYSVSFSLLLQNIGATTIDQVQVIDNIAREIAPAELLEVSALSVSGGLSAVNPAFDGITNDRLLTGDQSLLAGAQASISLSIIFDANGNPGPFFNRAKLLSRAGSSLVFDLSTDGEDPDPGSPGNNPGDNLNSGNFSEPTPIVLPLSPAAAVIGLAKELTELQIIGIDRYAAAFVLRVENLTSDVDANFLQVADDLEMALIGATDMQVRAAPSVTGALSLVNPAFGPNDQNLLTGSESLPGGASAEIGFVVEFTANGNTEFFNAALATTAAEAGGIPVAMDLSDDGAIVDANGNGRADDVGENDPTPIIIGDVPVIGLANELSSLEQIGTDQYRAVFTLRLANLSTDRSLDNVQIQDRLDDTFGRLPGYVVTAVNLSGALSEVNTNFDGNADPLVLSGNESLAPGAMATVLLSVEFNAVDDADLFTNQPIATASTDGGTVFIEDPSDDGVVVDANGNGIANEVGENDPTIFTLPSPARVGAAKALDSIVQTAPDSFELSFTLVVENVSATDAQNLQIVEDLAGSFPGVASIELVKLAASPELSLNSNFSVADSNLLTGTDTLTAGARATLTLTVAITGVGTGQFSNQITVTTATDPGGEPLFSDPSDDGLTVDADDDGQPNEATENDPTPITLPPLSQSPLIGLAKSATTPVLVAPGRFTTELIFVVENLGTSDLRDVQVSDDLAAVFGSDATFEVLEPPVATANLSANPDFDGITDTGLLTPSSSTLGVGQSASVSVTISVTPTANATMFLNIANTTAVNPNDVPTEDLSTDGIDPDPNEDGLPSESTPTPIMTAADPAVLGVAKQTIATRVIGPDQFRAEFRIVVENLGGVVVNNVQVVEDLRAAFADPVAVQVIGAPRVSGALSEGNASFDGVGNTNLLAGSESLPPGATAFIDLEVEIALNGASGPFSNQVSGSGSGPDGEPTEDLSDDGADPDPDNDGEPSEPGEDDPTPVTLPASLVGTVFEDLDHNGNRADNEPLLSGWVIELSDEAGNLVASAISDEQGFYGFLDVPPGNYTARVRHPDTNVVWGSTPTTLFANAVTVTDFPIVPGGRVYDSRTRELIPGVTLRLTDDTNSVLPDECLLEGQQNQTVARDAAYRFDVLPGANPACPTNASDYRIVIVEAPSSYALVSSVAIPPATEVLTVAACAIDPDQEVPCVVQPQTTAPSGVQDTTYFLTWRLGAGDGSVINNHLPLDQTIAGAVLSLVSISKQAEQSSAVVGDLINYEIRITNPDTIALSALEISDNLPAGFEFVAGSQTLIAAGADNVLDSLDDVVVPLTATGADPIMFGPFGLAANSSVVIRYLARVSTGVTQGEYINRATPLIGGTIVGNTAAAAVDVVGDPLFEQTTIIGRVFHDKNADAWQDEDEPGIPGVRLATVGGLLIETDEFGRYHLAAVDVKRFERGGNFILKLDTATLPEGATVISENPRVLRITQALMSRLNFAVALPQAVMAKTSTSEQGLRIITRHLTDRIQPVRFASGMSDIPDSYFHRLQELLDQYQGRDNLRLRFIGHTDNERLSPRAAAIYGDNQGLSEARAKRVADYMASKLNIPEDRLEIRGTAFNHPLAPNVTLENMALNRRVEIEILYDEEIREQISAFEPGETMEVAEQTRTASRQIELEPVRFATREATLAEAQKDVLRQSFAPYAGATNLTVTLVGHADAGLSDSSNKGYNEALGAARAASVSEFIAAQFGVGTAAIAVSSAGEDQPIASNDDAYGRALNRRVDIAVQYDEVVETIRIKMSQPLPVQLEASTTLQQGGRVWMTEDALQIAPHLDVLATQEIVVNAQGALTDAVAFVGYTNYAAFIDRYQLDVYAAADTDLIRPLATITAKTIGLGAPLMLRKLNARLKPGQQLAYVLQAFDQDGRADQTAVRLVNVVSESKTNIVRTDPNNVWGQNNLARQSIALSGSRVRVHGVDMQPNTQLQINGTNVPIDADGKFSGELQLPSGQHQIEVTGVDANGVTWRESLKADVDDNYTFIVALANLTVGDNNLSGNFETLGVDDHFDESVFVDGRLALYAKAKVKGKYLITGQLDSTEDELRNFGDNMRREDPRRIFRQLDPNRYYTVYGDDSTTVSDVDTQGAFYLRVDWDRNQVLWGNYNTGLTDTEFMMYNRSLYGAKVRHESDAVTQYGDHKRQATLFGSEAQSAAAHVTFRATGGSLYYLKHTDIVEGSEKVWIEVRRRDTQQVFERQDLIEGRDYEIDAIQGRIILRSPLSQVVNDRGPSIIRSDALQGDDVFLLADYEYVPDNFSADNLTYGGRAQAWLGDHVALGVNKVVDERGGSDFDMQGLDITIKAGKGTYLSAEIAQSESRQNEANFASADGGLSFGSQNGTSPSDGLDGDAVAIEARVNFADVDPELKGDARAWWKERDAEFSSGRLAQGEKVTDQGFETAWQASDKVRVIAGYNELEEEAISQIRIARVQADMQLSRFTVGGEIRYEDVERQVTGTDGEALLIGARVGYALNEQQTLYGSVQAGLDERGNYEDNNRAAAGINTQVNQHTAVSIEASDGDRGSALSGGVEYSPADDLSFNMKSGVGSGATSQFAGNYRLAEGHELYGSYAVDPDRSDEARNLLTFGQRRDMGNRLGIFTESQFGKDDRYGGLNHAFGMDYQTEQDWVLSSLLQFSENDTRLNPLERRAASIGASVKREQYKFSSKLEYRSDDSPLMDTEQYLLSTSMTYQADDRQRWLGLLNLSWTDDQINGGKDARFVEFDVGHAYRPVNGDRWNVLSKYGYFYDLVSEGQDDTRPDQRVHIIATEALYRLNARWELGGKIALKEGKLRLMRDSGSWEDYGLALGVVRGRYHLTKRWDGLAEYRYLRDRHGDNHRHGALVGMYRHIGENMKLGVGYNFTDFNDDLKDAEYDNHGWFVDLIGKW